MPPHPLDHAARPYLPRIDFLGRKPCCFDVETHGADALLDARRVFEKPGERHRLRQAFADDDGAIAAHRECRRIAEQVGATRGRGVVAERSEEHTSELQSLMRTSYAVFHL